MRDQGAAAGLSYTQFDQANIRNLQLNVPTLGLTVPNLQYNLNLSVRQCDRAFMDYMKAAFGPTWDVDSTSFSLQDWLQLYPLYMFPLVRRVDAKLDQVQVLSNHSSVPAGFSVIVVSFFEQIVQTTYSGSGASTAVSRM